MSDQAIASVDKRLGPWTLIRGCFWRMSSAVAAGFVVGVVAGIFGVASIKKGINVLPLVIFSVLATSLVFLSFERGALRTRIRQVLSDWAHYANDGFALLLMAICVLLGLVVTSFWGAFTPQATRSLYINASWSVWAGLAVSFCLLGPLAEELYFRGFVWDRLSTAMSPKKVGLASALLFLSMHFVNGALIPIFLIPLATILTLIRLRGLGLGVCFLAHALYNVTIIFGYFVQTHAEMFRLVAVD
jgi:membrane protease YdiL (CAAX protease family)